MTKYEQLRKKDCEVDEVIYDTYGESYLLKKDELRTKENKETMKNLSVLKFNINQHNYGLSLDVWTKKGRTFVHISAKLIDELIKQGEKRLKEEREKLDQLVSEYYKSINQ